MVVLSTIGGGWGSLTLVPLLAWARTRRFALALTSVLVVTSVLVFLVKRVARRPRPPVVLADVHALVFQAPTDFSFPSGHSAGSFAFAVFLALVLVHGTPPSASARARLLRRLAAASLLALALGVALSRVALGVHFPGDVTVGALVGTTVAWAGARLYLGRTARAEARGAP